eukprot:gene29910-33758_t
MGLLMFKYRISDEYYTEKTENHVAEILKPLIEQRADPYIYKHTDGYYYFTASVPQYDRIELRRARTIEGLAGAEKVDVWFKPEAG